MLLITLGVGCFPAPERPQWLESTEDSSLKDTEQAETSDVGSESKGCPEALDGCDEVGSTRCNEDSFNSAIKTCIYDKELSCLRWEADACPKAEWPECETIACVVADQTPECRSVLSKDGTACADKDLCIDGDTCKAGVCKAGTTMHCTDTDLCTLESCDSATGECSFPPVNCNWLMKVQETQNTDNYSCDVQKSGCGAGDPKECCVSSQIAPCTDGDCEHLLDTQCEKIGDSWFLKGCEIVAQDNGVKCTQWKVPVDPCPSDGKACTTPSCEDGLGCTMVSFNDGSSCGSDPCNVDQCENGVCVDLGPDTEECNDNNPCTIDHCIDQGGFVHKCEFTDNTTLCDDSKPCTEDKCLVSSMEPQGYECQNNIIDGCQ